MITQWQEQPVQAETTEGAAHQTFGQTKVKTTEEEAGNGEKIRCIQVLRR
jgi:hypothetical protein